MASAFWPFSEQFVLTDAEREEVMDAALKHVAGRVPVIVTTTHFSSRICAARSRQAQEAGAAMVMIMPPYRGATFRVSEKAISEFYRVVSDAIDIPIMIQDAPVAGTPLSVDLLARLWPHPKNVGAPGAIRRTAFRAFREQAAPCRCCVDLG